MVVFAIVLHKLVKLLDTLSHRGYSFKEQRKSVITQFVLFEIGFATQVFLQILIFFEKRKKMTDFTYAILQAFVKIIHNFIPSMYMLWSHHLTFR